MRQHRFRGVRVATRLHALAGMQLDACMHAVKLKRLLNAFYGMIISTACASSP